jgi:hypothetical protein
VYVIDPGRPASVIGHSHSVGGVPPNVRPVRQLSSGLKVGTPMQTVGHAEVYGLMTVWDSWFRTRLGTLLFAADTDDQVGAIVVGQRGPVQAIAEGTLRPVPCGP